MSGFVHSIYRFTYSLPFHTTLTLLGLLYITWREVPKSRVGQYVQKRKLVKPLCASVLFLWLFIMVYTTVISRTEGTATIFFKPFHQLHVVLNGGSKELIRSAWMNVLLFVPGGLLLSELVPIYKSIWLKSCMIAFIIAVISFGVEMTQWCWALGQAEADDIICNTLGGVIGIIIGKRE